MKKTKKRRLKKSVKNFMFYTLTSIIILIGGIILIGEIKSELKAYEQERETIKQNYITCIKEQDTKQGYIIRSACSDNWQSLDAQTNAQYKQIKKDLYLVKIGE